MARDVRVSIRSMHYNNFLSCDIFVFAFCQFAMHSPNRWRTAAAAAIGKSVQWIRFAAIAACIEQSILWSARLL